MMQSSSMRNMYSNRRRRKGRKPLYTRFLCDPDPWNGSPPKTPPSSDDEANDIPSEYLSSVSCRVAPAPIIKGGNIGNNHHQCNARLNEVKRKLSQYVFIKRSQLNVGATAPVPLPFNNNNNNNNNKNSVKRKKHHKLRSKGKQKKKQTAPAPKPPSSISSNTSSNNVENNEFKMRAFAEPFIPSSSLSTSTNDELIECISSSSTNDELIDFASIPEAYYVGYDNNIIYQNETKQSKANDEIFIYSPSSNSCSYEQFVFSDDSSIKLEEIHSDKSNDDDQYFNDDKFALLFEQILDEKTSNKRRKYNIKQRKYQPEYHQMKRKNIWAEPNHDKALTKPTIKQTLGGLLLNGLPPINNQTWNS